LQRFGVMLPAISNRLDVWAQLSQQPDEFHGAMAFLRKSSAGSHPVEVALDGEREQLSWIIAM
jgi:hypothetical protein